MNSSFRLLHLGRRRPLGPKARRLVLVMVSAALVSAMLVTLPRAAPAIARERPYPSEIATVARAAGVARSLGPFELQAAYAAEQERQAALSADDPRQARASSLVMQPAERSAAIRRAIEVAAIEAAIVSAAHEFGQSADVMLAVGWCESSYDPRKVGSAGERGVFQFMKRTWGFYRSDEYGVGYWTGNAARLGYKEADIVEPVASARVAAEMFSRGQQWQWTCWKKLYGPKA